MPDQFREGTARTPPALKAFSRALSRDLPNALSKATSIARATAATAGRPKRKTKG